MWQRLELTTLTSSAPPSANWGYGPGRSTSSSLSSLQPHNDRGGTVSFFLEKLWSFQQFEKFILPELLRVLEHAWRLLNLYFPYCAPRHIALSVLTVYNVTNILVANFFVPSVFISHLGKWVVMATLLSTSLEHIKDNLHLPGEE